MPRRFAFALLALLVLLLVGLLVGRRVQESRQKMQAAARPTPTRTIPPPPTPIPARLVSIWFESAEDGLFHPEAREVPAAVDDVAFLRSLGAAVLAGPRHPALLAPFPQGWTLRAAFRLANGLAVLDLAPPAPPTPVPTEEPSPEPTPAGGKAKKGTPTPTSTPVPVATEPPKRWETGASEEVGAAQSLVLTVTKNLPAVTHVILLVGGEPAETLAGHVDLTHPLLPDLSRAADEAPLVAPMPTPPPSPEPVAEASASPAPKPSPAVSPSPRATPRPTPRPSKGTLLT
ncbi:MAG: hypothetical protein U0529_19905 [Thermoanaerobaculia bacterium]